MRGWGAGEGDEQKKTLEGEKEKGGDSERVWRESCWGENWRKNKTQTQWKIKIKNKAGNQTVFLFLLSGNYTAIKAQLKEKPTKCIKSQTDWNHLKQGFVLFFFIFFFFILWDQHTTRGQHRSTWLSPLWQHHHVYAARCASSPKQKVRGIRHEH